MTVNLSYNCHLRQTTNVFLNPRNTALEQTFCYQTNTVTGLGSSKFDRQCWYFLGSQQILLHGPGTDISQEMDYAAVSQPRTSGWPPFETCAEGGVHDDEKLTGENIGN